MIRPLIHRLAAAMLIGWIGGCVAFVQFRVRNCLACDFTFSWRAARHLLAGENPYQHITPTGPYPWDGQYSYPLTAALVAVPFSALPPELAGALFFGFSSGLLGYALLKEGWCKLPLFLSAPYWVAAATGQWSPLITAATLLPWLQALALVKPNLGAAALFYKPNLKALVASAVLILVSVWIMPNWPVEWWQKLGDRQANAQYHIQFLAAFPTGIPLLAAVLYLRKPKGRLMLALAFIPQKIWFYDQLQLWLIPRGLRQSLVLTGLSWLAYGSWYLLTLDIPLSSPAKQPDFYINLFCYLPALAMLAKNQAGELSPRITPLSQRYTNCLIRKIREKQ
jgi:hypothetical protein